MFCTGLCDVCVVTEEGGDDEGDEVGGREEEVGVACGRGEKVLQDCWEEAGGY